MSPWYAVGSDGFRGPLDITRAATAVLDAQDVIIGWSPAAEELLGYPPEEILGRRVDTLLVGRSPPASPAAPPPDPGHRSEARTARHRDGHVVQVATASCMLSHSGAGPARVLVAAGLESLQEWEAGQAMLSGLATQSPISLAIYDTDLRLAWANAASEREMGLPLQEYLGKRTSELYREGEVLSDEYPLTLEEVMRNVLTTGEPVVDLHYRGRPPADPDHDHFWSCSYYRLQDARGHVLGVCEEAFDITDRYRAQQRLALLVQAGRSIGTTLDMTATARETAEVVVPQFADAVMIDLLEEVLEGEQTPLRGEDGWPLVRVAERSGTQVADQSPSEAYRVHYDPDSPQARSLSTGAPVLERCRGEPDAPWEEACCLVVPLRARDSPMGLVTFLRGENRAPFAADEVALAQELVRRSAVYLDNARRYTWEHRAALALQRNLLPQRVPPQSAVDVAYRYLPTDHTLGVGGDWFDVIPLSGTRVGLVVGDVVGHGLHAAATMGRLRTTVHALARLDLPPDELLTRLDDLVAQGYGNGEPESSDTMGVTCLYAVYNPVSRRCAMARAGHVPPAVIGPDGRTSFPELPEGPPLGLGGLPFESLDFALPEGSLLALFTDGLVRTREGDIEAGLETLSRALTDPCGSLEEMCDRVLAELLPQGPQADDAALLLARTHELSAHQVAVWELPVAPTAVGQARALVTERLAEWGLDALSFPTELVVSELVTNAIRHARGPVHLRLIRDRTLLCEVSDASHTSPHLRYSANDDEGGRGLFIVAQIVQRWGTRYLPTGKTIWTEQALPDSSAAAHGPS